MRGLGLGRASMFATGLFLATGMFFTTAMSAGCGDDKDGSSEATKSVYEALRSTCERCHGSGTNRPIFASLAAFETLVVQDAAWIVPGNPEESEFVELLGGTATGQYTQMPLGGESFSQLATAGNTDISMPEIEEWISELGDQEPLSVEVDTTLPTVGRKSADQLLRSLKTQTGLSDDVFFSAAYDSANAGRFAALNPDRVPMRNPGYGEIPVSIARYSRLGGHNYLGGVRGNTDISPAFTQSLVVISQTYCRLGITHGDGVLAYAELGDNSSDPQALIRIQTNIEYLYLRMLALVPSVAEARELLELYQYYEQNSTTEDAWTAICTALVRDPRWLSL